MRVSSGLRCGKKSHGMSDRYSDGDDDSRIAGRFADVGEKSARSTRDEDQ
jgi:hypothetical protein